MAFFISGDWGTTNIRLRLVDAGQGRSLSEVKSGEGIAATFEEWKHSGQPEEKRFPFYAAVLLRQIGELQRQQSLSLQGLPLLLSGMASSSLGLKELPYKELPCGMDGKDLLLADLPANLDFPHRVLLVSGVRTIDDVMRGEETQLTGCSLPVEGEEFLFIFPGTHSKHIRVRNGRMVDFKTYMTGEFFHLLSTRSILAATISAPVGGEGSSDGADEAFEQGVLDSLRSPLLHSSFLVRTRHLLGAEPKTANYYYLSGLLIGEELKPLRDTDLPLTIVGDGMMEKYYVRACRLLGCSDIRTFDASQALVLGHCKIYNTIGPLSDQL